MQKLFLSLKLPVLLLVLCLGCGQSARSDLAPAVPTLTLNFENGVAGVGRDGQTVAPRVEGKAELQEGKFGKAFKSGPGAGYLHFPTEGIVSTQAGTVEMWVSPLDWSGDEKAFHMFFAANGAADGEGKLFLYKYLSSGLGLLFLSHDGGKGHNRLANKNIDSWKPGEWHHIAATWWPSRQELYIDGKLAGSGLPSLPKSLNAEFLIGDHPFEPSVPRTSQSLIDGVRIYDRVLSPAVIAAHYAGDYGKTTPLDEQSTRLEFAVADNRLRPTLTLIGADVDTRAARADFSILQGERVVATQTNRPFNGVIAAADFADTFAPGDYVLRVALHDKNGQIGAVSQPLTVPSREWLNNTLGE